MDWGEVRIQFMVIFQVSVQIALRHKQKEMQNVEMLDIGTLGIRLQYDDEDELQFVVMPQSKRSI